jgi:ubiquinone/menaquinone biosynthesis C-methylase UbiE
MDLMKNGRNGKNPFGEGEGVSPEDLVKIFDRQARRYEKQRRRHTARAWRERLLRSAEGSVLEVAVGAGNNFPYYRSGIRLTAVDFSPEMIRKAKEAAEEYRIDATFLLSDVEQLEFPPDSFDTIVSFGSMCAYRDPVRVLKNFNRWCRRNGKVLLGEHGISSNAVLSLIQRGLDPLLYRIIGCHQTRDIMNIVEKSGLRVIRVEHAMADAFHLIWATPNK